MARLQSGHLWIYRSDVIHTDHARGGDVVDIRDEAGRSHGYAFFSQASQITLRWCAPPGLPPDLAYWRARFAQAEAYRQQVVRDTEA